MLPAESVVSVIGPLSPVYPPIGRGLADPGSQKRESRAEIDCSPLAGLAFSTGWFDDFEPRDATDPGATGVAPGWSSYDDLSKYSFHVPG